MKCLLSTFAAFLALSAAGCSGDDDDVVLIEPLPPGALTVAWSIGGGVDPDACFVYGADAFELLVFDAFGDLVVEIVEPCEQFATTVDLEDGVYDADATLIDPFNDAVTTTTTLSDLDVLSDTELVVEVDFPLNSFL